MNPYRYFAITSGTDGPFAYYSKWDIIRVQTRRELKAALETEINRVSCVGSFGFAKRMIAERAAAIWGAAQGPTAAKGLTLSVSGRDIAVFVKVVTQAHWLEQGLAA